LAISKPNAGARRSERPALAVASRAQSNGPDNLKLLVDRALDPDPARRPSVAALAQQLQQLR